MGPPPTAAYTRMNGDTIYPRDLFSVISLHMLGTHTERVNTTKELNSGTSTEDDYLDILFRLAWYSLRYMTTEEHHTDLRTKLGINVMRVSTFTVTALGNTFRTLVMRMTMSMTCYNYALLYQHKTPWGTRPTQIAFGL